MSINAHFFLHDEKLPSFAQWQAALDKARVDIVLEDVGDIRKHAGYLPASFRGKPSGFEWFYGSIKNILGVETLDGLNGRQHVINCVTHGDINELVCGMIACSVLLQAADGLFLDEESGGLMSAQQALELSLGIESEERESKRRMAEMDSGMTSRRCPECGSPCPEYRKTCRVCGFEIGRAN